jgi:hypothetical protein
MTKQTTSEFELPETIKDNLNPQKRKAAVLGNEVAPVSANPVPDFTWGGPVATVTALSHIDTDIRGNSGR